MNDDQKIKDNEEKNAYTNRFGKESLRSVLINIGKVLSSSPAVASEESNEEKKQIVKRGAYVCLFFTLGFLFSFARFPFGAFPLGLSLVGCASSHVLTISLGMLCGITVMKLPFPHFFALTILILIRILGRTLLDKPEYRIKSDLYGFIRYDLFNENIYLRLSAVSVSVFSLGLWNIISNNFMFYDLWGALVGMIVSPVCTYLFSLFFDSERNGGKTISLYIFMIASVYSLKIVGGIGTFLAFTASQVIILTLARRAIRIHVIALSLILGIICGIEYTPVFLLSVITFFIIDSLTGEKRNAAFLSSLLVSVIWGFAVDARNALYTVFPAALASAAIDNLIRACLPGISISDELVSASTKQKLITDTENEKRLERISESFANLSKSFKRLSDRLALPGTYEIRRECDDIIEKYCNECKNTPICWGEDYNTTIGFLADISTHLSSHGKIDRSIVPRTLDTRCKEIDSIISDINEKTKELYKDTLEKEKLTVFSTDYSALSKIINDSIAEKQAENAENRELTEKALIAMGKYKSDFHTVSVFGKRKIRVFARLKTLNENTVGMRDFKHIMEEVCGCSFSNPTLKIEGKSMTVTLNIKPVFKAEASASKASADEKNMCGDTPSFFEGHDNYFYAIISDGMGTGSNAALTSGICEVFLREMLEGGNRVDTSLSMLNAVLTAKNDECSATVDIMELDLLSGRASFVKSGAASSFILRDGNVYRLSARTMPLGILDEIDADIQKVRLKDGDTVFLVSDGNAPMDNYDELINIIKSTLPSDTLESISEKIISSSKKISKDDISCVVIRVSNL